MNAGPTAGRPGSASRARPPGSARRLVAGLALLMALAGSTAYGIHRVVAGRDLRAALPVHGTLRLDDPFTERNHCIGIDGFTDIGPATPVLLFEDGRIVGVTRLGPADSDEATGSCTWHWTMANVPASPGVYSIQVSNRGWVTATRDELTSGRVSLSLTRRAGPG